MKKISFIVLLVLSVSYVQAQAQANFGLKGGLNLAHTTNSNTGESGNKAGLHAGLLAHIHLTPQWSVQPELYYSSQGGTVSNVDIYLNYINIPLLLQYNFSGFRIQTGPQLGLLVGVKDKIDGVESNFFTSDDFKTSDFSWTFGASYLMPSGFGFDGRYNLGISAINDDPTRDGATKNRVFQLGVFYLLNYGR